MSLNVVTLYDGGSSEGGAGHFEGAAITYAHGWQSLIIADSPPLGRGSTIGAVRAAASLSSRLLRFVVKFASPPPMPPSPPPPPPSPLNGSVPTVDEPGNFTLAISANRSESSDGADEVAVSILFFSLFLFPSSTHPLFSHMSHTRFSHISGINPQLDDTSLARCAAAVGSAGSAAARASPPAANATLGPPRHGAALGATNARGERTIRYGEMVCG